MEIGFIGTGHVGTGLIGKFAQLGHSVKISNSRGVQSLTALSSETGATPVSLSDAVREVEVVVIAIPLSAMSMLPKRLFADVPDDVTIIETSNYFSYRDRRVPEIDAGKVEAVWVSEQLGRPTVKTFTNIIAHHIADAGLPKGAPGRIALAVSSNDEKAKRTASVLVDEAGFDPFDAGSLEDSWRQQPGSPAYCTDLTIQELSAALARAERANLPGNRDEFLRRYFENTSISAKQIVELGRAVFK
jgi:8-hydroxy-5-deazaflavin:NADPH oxidoreductase